MTPLVTAVRHRRAEEAGRMAAVEYLTTILRGILPRPESLRVQEETAGDVTVLTIHLPEEDRRFVVGKQGRTIEAVRYLIRAFAGRQGRMIVAKLPDDSPTTEETNERSCSAALRH